MDAKEFETIKGKIVSLRDKYSKTQGALESLSASAIEQFGTDDTAKLQLKVSEYDETIDRVSAKLDEQFTRLKGVTNWNLV
jgi:hypothetical protein